MRRKDKQPKKRPFKVEFEEEEDSIKLKKTKTPKKSGKYGNKEWWAMLEEEE